MIIIEHKDQAIYKFSSCKRFNMKTLNADSTLPINKCQVMNIYVEKDTLWLDYNIGHKKLYEHVDGCSKNTTLHLMNYEKN